MVIKYLVFESSICFENWQKEEKRNIMQISPMALGISGNTEGEDINMDISASIFVTYWEDA